MSTALPGIRYAIVIGLAASLPACTVPAIRTTATPVPPQGVGITRPAELVVFAAASLTEAFREIGSAFEASHPGVRATFNFAGSQQLAVQIEQGAAADVFASADWRQMGRLVSTGAIAGDAPVVFAHNRLVVVLPGDNPGQVERLQDLAKPGLKLVLAAEQVPAGLYARQVLDNLSVDPDYGPDFKAAVLRNVVSNEENVKQVVAKVRLGEADAGIAYLSDVTRDLAGKLRQLRIPDRFDVTATYPIAPLRASPQPDLADQFVRFVLSPDGQRILSRWGFTSIAE